MNFWGALAFNLYFITIVVSQNWLIQIYKKSFLIIIRPVLRSFYLCCTLSQLANLWFLSNESAKLNVTGLTPVDFLAIAYFITSFLSTSTANTGTLYLRIKICHREFGPEGNLVRRTNFTGESGPPDQILRHCITGIMVRPRGNWSGQLSLAMLATFEKPIGSNRAVTKGILSDSPRAHGTTSKVTFYITHNHAVDYSIGRLRDNYDGGIRRA